MITNTTFLPVTSVDILVNFRCNSNCTFCSIWLDKSEDIELKYILKFLYNLRGLVKKNTIIDILGGEPTLREDLDIIIGICNKLGFISAVTTNGYRLSDIKYAKKIADSGLKLITISLEGFEKENDKMRGIGNYNKTIEGIKNLRILNKNIRINIQTVLCDVNIYNTPKFILFLKENNYADQVNLLAINQDPRRYNLKNTTWWKNNHLWPKDYEMTVKTLDELIKLKKELKGIDIFNKESQLEFWKKYFLNPIDYVNMSKCNIGDFHIQLTNEGEIHLCSFIDVPIGNIKTDFVEDVFFGKIGNSLRERIYSCKELCHRNISCNYHLLNINTAANNPNNLNIA